MKTPNHFRIGTAILACCILLAGCTPCFYAPNAQNVPVLRERGEGNGTFSFQFGPLTTGWNVQGAVAIANHVGIIGNYNHYSDHESTIDYDGSEYSCKFKSNMGELGAGYFHTFKDKYVVEAYAGFGGSRINSAYDGGYGLGTSSAGSTSFFVQPSIAYYKKNIRLAFSSRLRMLKYRDFKYSNEMGDDVYINLDELGNLGFHGYYEPAFTFRTGGKTVKFQCQVGLSIPLDRSYYYEFDPVNFNFGIVFCLPGKENRQVN